MYIIAAASATALAMFGRYDECMLDRLLLESEHLGKSHAGQELHVEDLFHHGLVLQRSRRLRSRKGWRLESLLVAYYRDRLKSGSVGNCRATGAIPHLTCRGSGVPRILP